MTQPDLDFAAALLADPNSWPEMPAASPELASRPSAVRPPSVYAAHAAESAVEAGRLASATDRVLARLQQGEATNVELNQICYRYGARILELRRAGYPIVTEPAGRGVWLYRLTGGAA